MRTTFLCCALRDAAVVLFLDAATARDSAAIRRFVALRPRAPTPSFPACPCAATVRERSMEDDTLHDQSSEDVEVRCHARVSAGRVPSERCLHTCTLLVQDGSRVVYLYAGRGKAGALDDLHQLDLEGNVWTVPKLNSDKPAGRFGHSGGAEQDEAGKRGSPKLGAALGVVHSVFGISIVFWVVADAPALLQSAFY